MRRKSLSVVFLPPLAIMGGCEQSAAANDQEISQEVQPQTDNGLAPTVERQTFAISSTEAVNAVEQLGSPWSDVTFDSSDTDSFSGGKMRSVTGRGGSFDVATLADGRVWNISVRSGFGDKCGEPAKVERALVSLVSRLDGKLVLSDDEITTLKRGLHRKGGSGLRGMVFV